MITYYRHWLSVILCQHYETEILVVPYLILRHYSLSKYVMIAESWSPMAPFKNLYIAVYYHFQSHTGLLKVFRWQVAQGLRGVSGFQTVLRWCPGCPAVRGNGGCCTAWGFPWGGISLMAGAAVETTLYGSQFRGWRSWTWCRLMPQSRGYRWTVTPGTYWWI